MTDRNIIDQLWAGIGTRGRASVGDKPDDLRPLPDRVRQLIDWICNTRPGFRRSIPVSRDDHDELIHWTLVDLIDMADRLEMDLSSALEELAQDEQRDAITDPYVLGIVSAWEDETLKAPRSGAAS